MKKLIFIIAGVVFSTQALAGIGLVRICKAANAPSAPHAATVISQQNVKFYQTQTGKDNDPLSIIVLSVGQDNHPGCYLASAASNRGEPLPKKGNKWYRTAVDEGWKDSVSDGRYTSVKVQFNIPVEAEAIGNFLSSAGQITICRLQRIIELMDGKRVEIPADTYTGACDRNGEHCRNIRLKGEKSILGSSKSSCVTVNAELIETDGKPIKKGEHLLEQWSVPGFTPVIRAATDFK